MFIPIFSLVAAKLSLLKAIGWKGMALKGMAFKGMAFHPLPFYPNPSAIHSGFFYHPMGYWVPMTHANMLITPNEVSMSMFMARALGSTPS